MKRAIILGLMGIVTAACSKTEAGAQGEGASAEGVVKQQAVMAAQAEPPAEASAAAANPAASDPHAGLSNYGVAEVARLLDDEKITPVDANSPETRAKFGTLPGAILLSSSTQYDLGELPQSKTDPLVFFCANPRCTAAPKAAKKALAAGYSEVHVMRDGIKGWRQAGQETKRISG